MRTALSGMLLTVALLCFSVAAKERRAANVFKPGLSHPAQVFFKPAEAVSVQNAQYPPDTTADGVVVLDVSLTEQGQPAEVGALRDIPALTSAAAAAVQSWKFDPAVQNDMDAPSAITVAFVYRPPVVVWQPPPFSAAIPNPASSTNAVMPAGILAVSYADYPVNSTVSGAVIVQVSLDGEGMIQDTSILRGISSLNSLALAAAKEWKFDPARLEGETVQSNVVIAFIFAPPVPNPPKER
jgi:TonB family protein